MTPRLPGWERRVADVLEAARRRPYALGTHDCFRLACESVRALTGDDKLARFDEAYRTRREALRLIARYGSTVDAACAAFFGAATQPVKRARRGDICKYEDVEPHLGVCVGAEVAVLADTGLRYVPLSACSACWRIG
jgi:hypothetical protein